MVSTTPKADPEGLYGTREAAQLLGLAKSTICRYVAQGLIRTVTRKLDGTRLITGKEIIRVWQEVYY